MSEPANIKRRTLLGGVMAAAAALLRPKKAKAERAKDKKKRPMWIGHF